MMKVCVKGHFHKLWYNQNNIQKVGRGCLSVRESVHKSFTSWVKSIPHNDTEGFVLCDDNNKVA